jgi:hypothetical protein
MRRLVISRTRSRCRVRAWTRSRLIAALVAFGWLGGSAAQAESNAAPHLILTLKPEAAREDREIPAVDVTLSVDAVHVASGSAVLRLALVVDNVETSALNLENLSVTDAQGSVPLTTRDDHDGVGQRRWIAGRTIDGLLTVRYRAPITNTPNALGAAPPLELRTEDGGFSAQGTTFLVLPDTPLTYRAELKWDLSASPPDASGLSSFGVGNVALDQPIKIERLSRAFYMGGSVGREPAARSANGFFSAWQGSPPFDAKALLTWTQGLYDYYFHFFKPSVQPYGVFLRRNPINPGGGVESSNSFMGTFGAKTDAKELKSTLAHEMIHTFIAGFEGAEGEDQWYSEGIAVFYQRLMPLRAKAISEADFLRDLNSTAARYYTDALNTTPNDEIWKRFWQDTRIRTLPYDRGSLYFAALDTRVRRASAGTRSLDDLIFAMLDLQRRGEPVSRQAWIDLLVREAGPDAKTEFEHMLAGAVVLPESGAFGPCLRRTVKPMRRYELGFDPKVLIEPSRTIRGLVPGSAAQMAGLKNGDRILKPVPQDEIQGNQTELLTLSIQRGDEAFALTYLPRGETVQAYRWERVPGVPDADCLLPFHGAAAGTVH